MYVEEDTWFHFTWRYIRIHRMRTSGIVGVNFGGGGGGGGEGGQILFVREGGRLY